MNNPVEIWFDGIHHVALRQY